MINPRFALSFVIATTMPLVEASVDDFAALTGAELIERYIDTQTVDSELAYIELKLFDQSNPGSDVVKRRLLALTEKNANGFNYLIRLVRPVDVEGVSVLTTVESGKRIEQFLYLPAQGEAIRLANAGRSGSFLGSDFSYEDLVRETPGNFFYQRLADGEAQGEECAVVRATPKDSVDTQYRFRDIFLDPNSYEIRKIVFYGEDGEPTKELKAFEYRSPDIDGTTVRPRFAVMTNHETDTISVFKVLTSRLGLPIEDQLFDPSHFGNITPADVNALLSEIDVLQ